MVGHAAFGADLVRDDPVGGGQVRLGQQLALRVVQEGLVEVLQLGGRRRPHRLVLSTVEDVDPVN